MFKIRDAMIARGKCDIQMIYEKFIETSTFLNAEVQTRQKNII